MGYDSSKLLGELHWLYYAVMSEWTQLTGTSEFALRTPSVVGAIASIALLYGLARKMLGERVAFVASLLLALNPFFVKWSQQARSYTFLAALAIASTWLLLRAVERRDWIAWAEYGIAVTTMIVIQFLSALLLLPVHVLVAWRWRRARVTWTLILIASAPWIASILARGEEGAPTSWLRPPGFHVILDAVTSVSGALGVGLALAAIGAMFVESRWRLLLGAWAVLPLLVSVIGSVWKPMFVDRYLIISAPAFAILAAVSLIDLRVRLRIVAISAVAAATVVGLVHWYALDGSDNWTGENWREATAFVMKKGGARVQPYWATPAFAYYGGHESMNGWVLERAEYLDEFTASDDVSQWFGKRLHARFQSR